MGIEVTKMLTPSLPAARQPALFPAPVQHTAIPAGAPRLVYNPHRSYPAYSLLVGACEDGLPLLVDLLNPHTGPVLVAGDKSSGKTALLQSICTSAARLNGPAEVRPLVITSRPEEWRSLPHPRPYVVSASDEKSVASLLLELGSLYDQRREGDPGGQAVLLFIDELPELDKLFLVDLISQVQLRSLVENGPTVRIWTFAAVRALPALNLHNWLNLFHTRLIGRIAIPSARQKLAVHPGIEGYGAAGAHRFSYWDGAAWHSFWSVSQGGAK